MAILNVVTSQVGLVGVDPQIIYIETNDTYTAVTAYAYLNSAKDMGYAFSNNQMALVTTTDSGIMFLEVSVDTLGNVTLLPSINPGTVITPTIANHIATYLDTAGTLTEDPTVALTNFAIQAIDGNVFAGNSAGCTNHSFVSFSPTASKGSLRLVSADNVADDVVIITNRSHGQGTLLTIPDGGNAFSNFIISNSIDTQFIMTGNLQLSAGSISNVGSYIQAIDGQIRAGQSGGCLDNQFISFSLTDMKGQLRYSCADNSGNYIIDVTNASHNQSTTITIPDGAQAASNFIISNSNTTQHINTGALQLDLGSLSVGNAAGGGTFAINIYPAVASTGQLSLVAAQNSGNYAITLTNRSHTNTAIHYIPNTNGGNADFIISDPAATQVINSNDFQVAHGNIIVGDASSSSNNTFISYSNNIASGSLRLKANNNSGNFITTITQSPQSLASTYSIPNGGVSASDFIISNSTGTQTIATGSLALTSGSVTLTSGNLNITSGNVIVTTGNIQTQDGNVIAGKTTGSANNSVISYTPTSTLGNLTLKAANNAGNFNVIVTNASHGQSSTLTIPNGAAAASNFIISNSPGTQTIATGNLSIASPGDMLVQDGNYYVGNAAGCTRNGYFSYSMTAAKGKVVFAARDNTGDFLVRFSNQAHGQDSEYRVPDSGQATSNFIVSNHPTIQYIATGDLEVVAGSFNVGDPAGAVGLHYIRSYPGAAASGYLGILGVANAGDYPILIQNVSMGQSTTFRLPDPGVANAVFVINGAVDPVAPSNVIYKTFFTEISAAALAAGGFAVLQTTAAAGVWGVLDITINDSSTDFSGGGGDRNIAIESYTGAAPSVVFSIIPALTLAAIPNAKWGSLSVPAPVGFDYMTQWGGGDSLVAKYDGGTTDYAAGLLKVSVTLVQIA